ncbi:MAG TPA: MBL fold metallo-hydrolase [Thermoanaerobaculia bacterium]|jgi:glyoxylase-like metal-dependent hydrolase (beta-lactamase superfamily II)
MRVERLGEDLFHFRGEAYDSGSLAILDGKRVLLVDGLASVGDAQAMRRILVEGWGTRVELCVSTHFFSDHMAAWNLFPEAELLAHADAVSTFRSEQFRTPEEAAHFREPTRRLAGSLQMTWGRYRVEVFESPGHTADALGVDVPDADLLHVGDSAVGRMAYLYYAAPEPMDRALERALGRGRGRILRSHGPVAGPEALRSARGYLRGLEDRVRGARQAGTPIEEIPIAECLPPGEPATDFETFFHARNLESIRTRGLFPREAAS